MNTYREERRDFLRNSLVAGATLAMPQILTGTLLSGCSSSKSSGGSTNWYKADPAGFQQRVLGYSYDALEPVIDAKTMEIHYTKHAAAYAKNLQDASVAEKVDTSKPLGELLANISKYSVKLRNNAGGHYNHELFWRCMSRDSTHSPAGRIQEFITRDFGNFETFKTRFTETAMGRFGSGWAWLYLNTEKKLMIGSTPNQDNPLMDISEIKGFPVLGLDVWEHAYYLKYQNKRAEYIENWWKVVDWNYVNERFSKIA